MTQLKANLVKTPAAAPAASLPDLLRALLETTKPRITRLVTITSGVGFAMAAVSHTWSFGDLLLTTIVCLVGTALSAAGANSLNQWMERDRDALMLRTAHRPVPSGRVTPRQTLVSGLVLTVLGPALLALLNPVSALVALTCTLVYVLAYTPLKPITPLATYVGAIPGALPPLIGWTAAAPAGLASLLDPGGLTLFAIMFIWQIPHFLAIAWMYREDYVRGGYRVLPSLPDGEARTIRAIVLWTLALIPATLAPYWTMQGRIGEWYLAVAGITGAAFGVLALRLVKTRARPEARTLFIASIIHLPVLFMALVASALLSLLA